MNFIKVFLFRILKLLPLRNLILFESHSDFCDNSRVLFEFMLSAGLNQKYRMIWLVEDPEAFQDRRISNVKFVRLVPESYLEKIKYYYYLSSARFAFYTHRSPPLKFNRGEVFINLWHGSGIKRPASLDMARNFDYVLCSSDYFKEIRIRNFSIQADKLLPLGNPRNDLFFEEANALEKIIDHKFSKVILWMPTFRATKNERPEFINYNSQSRALPIVDCDEKLKELDSFLTA